MSITDALEKAKMLLQSCNVPMRDAAAAGTALQLIDACINALQNPAPAEQKEVSK